MRKRPTMKAKITFEIESEGDPDGRYIHEYIRLIQQTCYLLGDEFIFVVTQKEKEEVP